MEYVFRIPIPPSVWIFLAIIIVIVFLVLLLTIIPVITFSITLTRDQLKASSPIMFKITVNKKDLTNITTVDLREHPELKPTIRTFGAGLPGYKLGWFRLASGAKAFLAVSSDKAVVIKLKEDTYVILTPKNINEFIDRLQELEWIRD